MMLPEETVVLADAVSSGEEGEKVTGANTMFTPLVSQKLCRFTGTPCRVQKTF